MSKNIIDCESGQWSGEPCDSKIGEFRIAFVQPHLRGTAKQSGSNFGLTTEIKVCAGCYNHLLSYCSDVAEEARYIEFVD